MKAPLLSNTPIHLLCALILINALTGCFQARPVALYTLNTASELQPINPAKKTDDILIGPVHLASYLDQPRMIQRRSSTRIDADAGHQWAGDLAQMIGNKISIETGILLKPASVSLFSATPPNSLAQQVTIDILRFEDDSAGNALVEVRWTIISLKDSSSDGPHISLLREPLANSSHEDLAIALNRALTDFNKELATTLAGQPSKKYVKFDEKE